MGFYINPVGDESNFDKWEIISQLPSFKQLPEAAWFVTRSSDKVHIVEIVSAVGIAIDKQEASYMADPRDRRPKRFGYISWDDLKKVDPLIYNSAKRYYKE